MHHGHQQRAEVAARRDRHPKQCRRRAAHALRCLVVEELEVANGRECFGDPMQCVLRHEPEGGDGDRGGGVVEQTVGRRRAFASHLDEAGDEGGDGGESEPDSHAVEERDATVETGEATGEGDEGAVVEGDGEKHGEHGEDRHGAGGDTESRARREAAVHGACLLDGEGVLLGVRRDDEDTGGPNGGHPDHRLQLLDAVHRAQTPRVGPAAGVLRGLVVCGDDRRLVQETVTRSNVT